MSWPGGVQVSGAHNEWRRYLQCSLETLNILDLHGAEEMGIDVSGGMQDCNGVSAWERSWKEPPG